MVYKYKLIKRQLKKCQVHYKESDRSQRNL